MGYIFIDCLVNIGKGVSESEREREITVTIPIKGFTYFIRRSGVWKIVPKIRL